MSSTHHDSHLEQAVLAGVRDRLLERLWRLNWVGIAVIVPVSYWLAVEQQRPSVLAALIGGLIAQAILGFRSLPQWARISPSIAVAALGVWSGFSIGASTAGATVSAVLVAQSWMFFGRRGVLLAFVWITGVFAAQVWVHRQEPPPPELLDPTILLNWIRGGSVLCWTLVVLVVCGYTWLEALKENTDRHTADAAKIRAAKQAQRVAEQKLVHMQRVDAVAAVASGVASAFASALTVVSLEAEALKEQQDDLEGAQNIADAARYAASLTQQLQVLADGPSRTTEGVELRQLVSDTLRMATQAAPEGVTLTMEGPKEAVWASSHATEFRQVLMNLLFNAIYAVGESGTVRVELLHDDKGVVVRVSDSGPGIAPEHINRLFEPFFTTKPAGKGTGIGLALSRQLVESWGGKIGVGPSVMGRGATFQIEVVACEAPPSSGPAAGPRELAFDRAPRVALVGGARDLSETLAVVLRHLGCEVVPFEDPALTREETLDLAVVTGANFALADLERLLDRVPTLLVGSDPVKHDRATPLDLPLTLPSLKRALHQALEAPA